MLGNEDALAAFATGRRSRHQFARDLFGLVGKKSIGISPTELEMKILTIFVSVAPMRNSASVSDGVLIPIEFPICHAKGANLRPIMGTCEVL